MKNQISLNLVDINFKIGIAYLLLLVVILLTFFIFGFR